MNLSGLHECLVAWHFISFVIMMTEEIISLIYLQFDLTEM